MIAPLNQLTSVLCRPESAISLGLVDWDMLIRQARCAGLLGRLCTLLEDRRAIDEIPLEARRHLESEKVVAQAHERSVRWEVSQIRQALEELNIPVILLKGAAYVLGGLPPGRGRLFHDVDILVPKQDLDVVERALLRNDWISTHLDEYDQRYYRKWMHELPPLRHIRRQTVLDVHHTILPETSRLSPDPAKLIAEAQQLEGEDGLKILAPVDMVLHSAVHLFHDGEFEQGLRDLVDLDGLLRHFGRHETFWLKLTDRSIELDLKRPLYYALRYTHSILGTPIPEEVQKKAGVGSPGRFGSVLMDGLFACGLAPGHPSCDICFSKIGRWFLYVRSHSLRMPMHLLIPHLIRKAVKRRTEKG